MPRYKFFLLISFIILLLFFTIRSAYQTGCPADIVVQQGQPNSLPGWLTRAHRLSGPYAFDYIPLELDGLAKPDGDPEEQDPVPPAGSTYINPGGSPYPPGSLADMIWQQKQRDQRYND